MGKSRRRLSCESTRCDYGKSIGEDPLRPALFLLFSRYGRPSSISRDHARSRLGSIRSGMDSSGSAW